MTNYKTENELLRLEITRLKSELVKISNKHTKLNNEHTKLNNEHIKLNGEYAQLNNEYTKLKTLNDRYLEQFRLSQHRRFGSKSERTQNPNQLGLFNEAELLANKTGESDKMPESDKSETVNTYTRKKRKGKREEFYEGIPTEQIIHELPKEEQVCPECGGLLHACGHEVLHREVELIPAQVRAIEHIQTVYVCRNCEQNSDTDTLPMKKASVPKPVISGSGMASPSLLSFIMCNKYVLALPLYRQEQELKRVGIHISRQTMAN